MIKTFLENKDKKTITSIVTRSNIKFITVIETYFEHELHYILSETLLDLITHLDRLKYNKENDNTIKEISIYIITNRDLSNILLYNQSLLKLGNKQFIKTITI